MIVVFVGFYVVARCCMLLYVVSCCVLLRVVPCCLMLRVVACCFMLRVVACCFMLRVVACCFMLRVVACCFMLRVFARCFMLRVVTCCCLLHVVACCCLLRVVACCIHIVDQEPRGSSESHVQAGWSFIHPPYPLSMFYSSLNLFQFIHPSVFLTFHLFPYQFIHSFIHSSNSYHSFLLLIASSSPALPCKTTSRFNYSLN